MTLVMQFKWAIKVVYCQINIDLFFQSKIQGTNVCPVARSEEVLIAAMGANCQIHEKCSIKRPAYNRTSIFRRVYHLKYAMLKYMNILFSLFLDRFDCAVYVNKLFWFQGYDRSIFNQVYSLENKMRKYMSVLFWYSDYKKNMINKVLMSDVDIY